MLAVRGLRAPKRYGSNRYPFAAAFVARGRPLRMLSQGQRRFRLNGLDRRIAVPSPMNVAETDRSHSYIFIICQSRSPSWQRKDPSIPIPTGRWS
jgi:hypothetical protein